jgi:hypothetical protein
LWLLPSLDRPGNLARFFSAWRKTQASTPGMVLVDEADDARHLAEYLAIELPIGWHWRVTPAAAVSQGDKIRAVWDEVKDCAWLGLVGDDCIPETPNWDRQLLDQLHRFGMVSCDDCWQAPQRVGNCWIVSGPLIRLAGYLFPPGLQHLYVDDVWEEIGRAAQCWRVRMNVRVRHAHVLKGEAAADDTHRRVYGGDTIDVAAGLWPQDRAAFGAWHANDRDRLVAAVRAARAGGLLPAPPVANRSAPDESGPDNSPDAIKRRLARAQSGSVMLLVPSARCPCFDFMVSWAETCLLLERLGLRYATRFLRFFSNLPRARNELAARFLAAGFDKAVYLDDDMGWTPNDVVRLLASDKPVAAGVGRKKVDLPNDNPDVWCFTAEPGPLTQDEMGFVLGRRVGTAFLKIERRVFLELAALHPEWKLKGSAGMEPELRANYWRFFEFGPNDESEDFVFCDRWRAAGGQIWIDPTIALGHTGEHVYRGRIGDLMQAMDAAA